MDVKDFKIQWFPGHMTKARRMMEDPEPARTSILRAGAFTPTP